MIDNMMMFEAAEELFAVGEWHWEGDEIVWDNDNTDSVDKDVSND